MSTKPNNKERLSHILDAIDRIHQFTDGMDLQTFSANEMAQFAVIKNFEIIGEAAYHVSNDLKVQHPEVEWKKIQAFRHILVHDYYKINLGIIWRSKESKLGELKNQVAGILREL